jgi:hypothetical protein
LAQCEDWDREHETRRSEPPLAQLFERRPLRRLNGEVKRRTDVVGIVCTSERVMGRVQSEQREEWQVARDCSTPRHSPNSNR